MYQCNNRTSGETDVLETEPDIKQHENTCNDQCLDRIGTHLITDGRTNTLALDCGFINTKLVHQHLIYFFTFAQAQCLCLNCHNIAAGYGTCLDGIIIDNLCDFRYNLVLYLLNGIIFTKICGDGCTTLKLQTEIQSALSGCSVTDHSNKSGYDHNEGKDKTYPAMLHEIDGLMFFCTSV